MDEVQGMTRDDIMLWAVQARLPSHYETGEPMWPDRLERFAALVAAHEREACAKVCEDTDFDSDADFYRPDFAAAIRARGETK